LIPIDNALVDAHDAAKPRQKAGRKPKAAI